MSTPSAPSSRSSRVSFAPRWSICIVALTAGLLAVAGCREDPASPGDPIRPPSGGIGSTAAGGGSDGGTGGVLGTGATTGGGSTTTGNADAVIELWYGEDQTFGTPDGPAPQKWINVLGHASAPLLESATYSVNGGPETELPLGPDNTRLDAPGDFNIEIERETLATLPETNSVSITLTVVGGAFLTKEFTLRVHEAARATLPFEVDWAALSDVAQVNQVAAIVDGKWELAGGGVEVAEDGYDRLIALGDRTWQGDYEVLATFELERWSSWGGVGLAVGWNGHEGSDQPRLDWPLEGLTWVRNVVPQSEMQIMTFEKSVQTRKPFSLELGTPYSLRAHTERTASGAHVSMRIWPAAEDEPSAWDLQTTTYARDGGVLLVNHHADVRWGTVRVTALP